MEQTNDRLLERARAFTRYVRGSPARLSAIASARGRLKKDRLQPVLDVPTRWVSLYYMLERFIELYPAYALCAARGDFADLPSRDFVDPAGLRKLKSFLQALAPVEEFVRLAEGDYASSLAVTPVLLRRCLDALSPHQEGQADHIERHFRDALFRGLSERLSYVLSRPNLALAAAALHPKYGHLKFVEPLVRDAVWMELARWVADPECSFPVAVSASVIDANADAAEPVLVIPPPSMNEVKRQLFAVRTAFEHFAPESPTELRPGSPLLWWRKQETENLAAISSIRHLPRIVFSVPANSATTVRLFSVASRISNTGRAALGADKVEMMTVLSSIMRHVGSDEWDNWLADRLDTFERE